MAAASSALAALRADGRPQSTKDPRRWKGNRVGLAHVITGPLRAAVNAAQRGVVRTLRRQVDARSGNRYDRDRLVRPAQGARRQLAALTRRTRRLHQRLAALPAPRGLAWLTLSHPLSRSGPLR